jgi:S1-C subfamily serine protease
MGGDVRKIHSAIGAACLLAATGTTAATPAPLAPGTQTRPVELSRLVAKLNRGQRIGQYKVNMLCMGGAPLTWGTGGKQELDVDEFSDIFGKELGKLGFQAVGHSNNLFEEDEGSAEYLVGGTITNIDMNLCFPGVTLKAADSRSDWNNSRGKAAIEVNWQIFSRLDRKVVATLTTTGTYEARKQQSGGIYAILFQAFGDSVRQLAASDQFRAVFIGSPVNLSVARVAPTKFEPIEIALPPRAHASVADAAGSTVLILSGSGHGSGFLISPDGLVLTNAHVAGGAKYLKIRWSDGVETLGEVTRIDKARDVALIKTDPRNRSPFAIRRTPATVGEDVYAIGAPLETNLQGTVSKGIVSANRVIDGLSYIQSDVTVNPGNSGGPLLDANRNLIGLTVAGMSRDGVALGVNYFIPIGDAADFLGLVPRAPTAARRAAAASTP